MSFKEKSKIELKTICALCGKPKSEKAQSNVTRFLSIESRCSCAAQPAQTEFDQESNPPDIQSIVDAIDNPLNADGGTNALNSKSVNDNLGERYEVQSLLGKGGMGAVYKVRDKELAKTFAIKVLNSNLVEDKSSLKRFEQEAQAASGLTSPNLVAVYDYGMGKNGSPYIVMDYLDGTSLDTAIKTEGYLDVPRALDIFVQTCDAIAHAHSKDVIHRDIKPSNIMLTKAANGGDFVKLVDFGIAKVLPNQNKAATNLTQTGEIFGSPLYMSPEQCVGNKLDARSDIYAFGCVMYEALTGSSPFDAENPIKIILKHVNEQPKPFSELKHEYKIPKDLESIVMRCLEKAPEDRYQSADMLAKDLQQIRDGKALVLDKKQVKQKNRPANKFNPYLLWLLGSFVLIFVLRPALTQLALNAHPGSKTTVVDPISDAKSLDNLSYQYFIKGDYQKAIPLLQFGLSSYSGTDQYYLADNYNHIGKCYKELGKFKLAAQYYEIALKIYGENAKIHGPGYGMESEARADYAAVLRKLNNPSKAALVASGKYTPETAEEPSPNMQ